MLHKIKEPPYYVLLQTPKKFQAILVQIGTSKPVATIIKNDFENLTIERLAAGQYEITWDNFADTVNTVFIQNSRPYVITSAFDNGAILIETYNVLNTTLEDDLLNYSYVEVTGYQVYNG